MHLARTVRTIMACKESIWQAYKKLYGQDSLISSLVRSAPKIISARILIGFNLQWIHFATTLNVTGSIGKSEYINWVPTLQTDSMRNPVIWLIILLCEVELSCPGISHSENLQNSVPGSTLHQQVTTANTKRGQSCVADCTGSCASNRTWQQQMVDVVDFIIYISGNIVCSDFQVGTSDKWCSRSQDSTLSSSNE